MNLYKYTKPSDTVRLCRRNVCIEAKGQNGKLLVVAVCITLVLIGLSAFINANK